MSVQVTMPLEEFEELKKYKDNFEQYNANNELYYKQMLSKHIKNYDDLREKLETNMKNQVDDIIKTLVNDKSYALVFVSELPFYNNSRQESELQSTTKYLYKLIPIGKVKYTINLIKSVFK